MLLNVSYCKHLVITEIKRLQPDIEIVAGGQHISSDPEMVKWLGLRYGFRGEVERTLPVFCDFIINKKNESGISDLPGLITIKNGEVHANDPEYIEDLDSLPFPKSPPITHHYGIPTKGIGIITSRGCPFNCVFCHDPKQPSKMRFRSLENVFCLL